MPEAKNAHLDFIIEQGNRFEGAIEGLKKTNTPCAKLQSGVPLDCQLDSCQKKKRKRRENVCVDVLGCVRGRAWGKKM